MEDLSTHTVYQAALSYAKRGWAVIPVHGIDPNTSRCTCARDCGTNAGKHPIDKDWPDKRLSLPDLYEIFVVQHPHANVGVITGEASGVWGFDVDPKNGGNDTLAALIAEHGELPKTYRQRTGSGGEHYVFKLPDFPVRSDTRGKIFGDGIDIRGSRNQIVMAGSRSGVGEYTPLDDVEPLDTPSWMIEALLRAPVVTGDAAPTVVEVLPEYSRLDPDEQERVQRYALSVIEDECRLYVQANPGDGNSQLFRSACSILEIAQSPWNIVSIAEAEAMLDRARLKRINTHQYGGGQSAQEFSATWRSARSTVAGQGRPCPRDPREDLDFDYPFDGPPAAKPGDGVASDFDFDETPRAAALGLTPSAELERLLAYLHNRDQLDEIKPPVPLISRVLDVGTSVILAGAFGTFKTFVSVGWACSVASGTPWLGHEVLNPGTVLYVAAEGASGIKRRVEAWEARHGVRVPADKLWVVSVSVNIGRDEPAKAILTLAKHLNAKLVIFDTLHRCTAGLDENSNTDMSRLNVMSDALREATGATTVYVHHTGHTGTRARGASGIQDDADFIWLSKLTTDNESRDPKLPRVLEQRKTKDSPELEEFYVKLDLVDGTDSGTLALADEKGQIMEGVAGIEPFENAGYEPGITAVIEVNHITSAIAIIKQVYLDAFSHGDGGTKAEIRVIAMSGKRDHYVKNLDVFQAAWGRMTGGDEPMLVRVTGSQKYRYLHEHERTQRLQAEPASTDA